MRWLALGAAVLAAGCVRLESSTRVERGPLLRTFPRAQVVEGGVRGSVAVEWPKLSVELTGYDVCRDLTVEEYAEEHITEHGSPAAGPAFSMGVTGLAASAALFASSFFLSTQPNLGVIDVSGHYGPSAQQQARGWSVASVVLGLPAMVVGVAAMLQVGEETETVRVEQIAGQKEADCHARPVVGPVDLKNGGGGVLATQVSKEGTAEFLATELTAGPEKVGFYGREVELDAPALALLDGFSACVELLRAEPRPVESMDDAALVARAQALQRCRRARKEQVQPEIDAAEGELRRRREEGAPGTLGVGPPVKSWEEALTVWTPKLRLEKGAVDLSRLDEPEKLDGQAVVLEGVIARVVSASIGVLQVGERDVLLFLPPRRPWGGEFGEGARVQVVAVAGGTDELNGARLPLFKAAWIRAGF